MESKDWEQIRNFKEHERWGDKSLIRIELIKELDDFRDYINSPVFISCGTQGQHSPNSLHYTGMAVDVMFPKLKAKDLPDLLLTAMRFNFSGIGIYPHWTLKGDAIGGMHLDIRRSLIKSLWIGLANNRYLALSFKSLNDHF